MDRNIFKAIRDGRIIQIVMYKGISAAADNFGIEKSEILEIVLKAIKGHENMIEIHQDSIDWLDKRTKQSEERDRKTRLCQGNVCCYFCGENWHLSKDCSCFKCGRNGHVAKDCIDDNDNDDGEGEGDDDDDDDGEGECDDSDNGDDDDDDGDSEGDDSDDGDDDDDDDGEGEVDDGNGGSRRRFGCYKCGQVGHRARKCDQVGGGDCVCYYCGETGHIAWECSHGCSLCRKNGHMGKDCPELSCRCGENGHYPYECPRDRSNRNDDRVCCNICGGEHTANDCSGVGCYKCSEVGHLGRDCGQVWGGGGGNGVCYYCGLRGYMAVCSLCGEIGHLGKDCW